jgi:hypothetical protein
LGPVVNPATLFKGNIFPMATVTKKGNVGVQEHERTLVFINGPNLYNAARALGMALNYSQLRAFYDRNSDLIAVHTYMVLPNDPDIDTPLHPLMKFLSFNGFITHAKYTDMIPADGDRPARLARPSLACDVMAGVIENLMLARQNSIERLIFIGADADYEPFFELFPKMGIRVTLVGITRESLKPEYGTPSEYTSIPSYTLTPPALREGIIQDFVELGVMRQWFHDPKLDRRTVSSDTTYEA